MEVGIIGSFFILLTHEESHREVYQEFKPSYDIFLWSGAKGCSEQYNKNHVSFLNMIKLNISETFISISFYSKIWDPNEIDDRSFLSQALHIKL